MKNAIVDNFEILQNRPSGHSSPGMMSLEATLIFP